MQVARDYGLQALIAVGARLFLTYRLAVRLMQVLALDGGAKTTPWRVLLIGFALLDMATWRRLRKPEGLGFKTRLTVDSIDMAVWSLAPYTPLDRYWLAVFIATPLAIDTGMRRPRIALAVPVVTLATTSLVRFVAGRTFQPLPFVWLLLAAAAGIVLSRYDSQLRLQVTQDWSRRRAADDRRAYLAGQNAVAMGANSVVDGIEGLVPLIGRPTPGSALWQLADGWKSSLCELTRREGAGLEAAYLGDALKEWEVDHNRHPDLASRVALLPTEGIGTTLITGRQVLGLWERLHLLDLRGRYPVEIVDPAVASRPPGGSFQLHVGEHVVEVPVDLRERSHVYDPGAVSFVLVGLLALGDVVQMHVELAATVGSMFLFLGAGVWSHRRLRRLGPSGRPATVALAVVVAITTTTAFSRSARQFVSPAGAGLYPVVPQLDLLAIVAGMYRKTVRGRALVLAAAGAGSVAALAWLLHPGPRSPTDLVLYLVWPLCALATAWDFSPKLDQAVALHAHDLTVDDVAADDRAFRNGQAVVIDLIRRARADVHAQLWALRSTLPSPLFRVAETRLAEVDARLDRLQPEDRLSEPSENARLPALEARARSL